MSKKTTTRQELRAQARKAGTVLVMAPVTAIETWIAEDELIRGDRSSFKRGYSREARGLFKIRLKEMRDVLAAQ